MADFSNTKIILHELEQLFNRDDDIKDILDIKKMQTEIELHSAARLKDAKQLIKEMTLQVAAKEADIKAPSQSDHSQALKRASNKENITKQCEAISKIIDSKRQNISKMAATTLSLKERANEFTNSATMADSRTAYAISLYAKISNITWDYKAAPGKLKGCIGVEGRKEMKEFELDTRACTSFELANSLWEVIGESQTQTQQAQEQAQQQTQP